MTDLRTTAEPIQISSGYGATGVHFGLKMFTFRWERFYWSVLQAQGAIGVRDGAFLGEVGTEAGYPIHLFSTGRDELRLGLVLAYGEMHNEIWGQDGGQGILGGVKAAYVHKFFRHFGVELGLQTRFFIWSKQDYPYPDLWGYLGLVF